MSNLSPIMVKEENYDYQDVENYISINHSERIKEVSNYIDENEEEILNHVSKICHKILKWYNGRMVYLGDFLQYLLLDEFVNVAGMADKTNKRLLDVYASFLYNIVPINYQSKAEKDFGGN